MPYLPTGDPNALYEQYPARPEEQPAFGEFMQRDELYAQPEPEQPADPIGGAQKWLAGQQFTPEGSQLRTELLGKLRAIQKERPKLRPAQYDGALRQWQDELDGSGIQNFVQKAPTIAELKQDQFEAIPGSEYALFRKQDANGNWFLDSRKIREPATTEAGGEDSSGISSHQMLASMMMGGGPDAGQQGQPGPAIGQPAPPDHNLPVLGSDEEWDRFPGGLWVAPNGTVQRKPTQEEWEEETKRRDLGSNYEWVKQNNVPLVKDRKAGRWVVDEALWKTRLDVYNLEHPKPAPPSKAEVAKDPKTYFSEPTNYDREYKAAYKAIENERMKAVPPTPEGEDEPPPPPPPTTDEIHKRMLDDYNARQKFMKQFDKPTTAEPISAPTQEQVEAALWTLHEIETMPEDQRGAYAENEKKANDILARAGTGAMDQYSRLPEVPSQPAQQPPVADNVSPSAAPAAPASATPAPPAAQPQQPAQPGAAGPEHAAAPEEQYEWAKGIYQLLKAGERVNSADMKTAVDILRRRVSNAK